MIPHTRDRRGRVSLIEPTWEELARFRTVKILPFEHELRALFRAAENLHRAYSRAATYGGDHREIGGLEAEYDRLKHELDYMRDRPHWRETMRRTDSTDGGF
jgi:hypothetical protein